VVNQDQINAFFANHRAHILDINILRQQNLDYLYSEFVHNPVQAPFYQQDGWQVIFTYIAIVDNDILEIKLSPMN